MYKRKDPLTNNQHYHVFSRSIAKFTVFNNDADYLRIIDILNLYRYTDFNYKYSRFIELESETKKDIINNLEKTSPVLVEIIAYCIMPTHIHLILKQVSENGISNFMSKILNCYTRYFNIHHKRTGPLWEGRFKNVLILTNEQLLHLTRYAHLNPTSAGLVKNPEDWQFSSYHEYIKNDLTNLSICTFDSLFDFNEKQYEKFVLDHKSYQKNLSLIKHTLIDDYSG